MNLEIVGLVIVISHLMVVGSILLWFGLGKPKSWEKFRAEFKTQFLGMGSHAR